MNQTLNNLIAVEPFQIETTLKSVKRGGLHVLDQTVSLIKTKAVHTFTDQETHIVPGTFVFVKGNAAFQPWAKQVYDYSGVKFVLVPKSEIVMVSDV